MSKKVIVIGAGIGGLTAGALLAKRGSRVTIYDQAYVAGGCASTFKRRGFTFDVGATQVAGLEPGGIHQQIFTELGIEEPPATPCDPACAVYLPGESSPINVWRDPEKWRKERQYQLPNSEPFWQLMGKLFQASWHFQQRDPVLPPCNLWDTWQLMAAVRPETLITLPFTFLTVGNILRAFGLDDDPRLKTFLDMQLKLYSQVNADETASLYAATALGMSQAPQGLWHLHGSMQTLSTRLVKGLRKHGGKLRLRHRVQRIHTQQGRVTAIKNLSQYFHLTADTMIHQEAATPRTFARFTARNLGYVGGLGQRVSTFGPFGFANRTPIKNLWLVGDATHPGEGTAGVSYSALTAVRQMEK